MVLTSTGPSLCPYFHVELPGFEGGCCLWEGRGRDMGGTEQSPRSGRLEAPRSPGWEVVSWCPQGRPLLQKDCVPTTQMHMLKPHPPWDGVRWWGLWEVTGLG